MKKIFTLFAAMMLFVGGAFAERVTLWESETPEGTLVEWGKQLAQQAAGQNFNVGDKLILTVVKFDTSLDDYPQVGFKGSDWENVGSFNIVKDKEMPYEATFSLSASDVAALSGGFWISGTAAWVTKLEYEANASTEDLSHAIWIGEKVFDGWGMNIEVKKDVFVDTKVGDEIRCYYKDRKDDFNLVPKTNGWTDIKDGDTKVEKDGYVSLIVTENMLQDLQATGFAIQGLGFTLTHIDLLSATPDGINAIETAKPVQSDVMYNLSGQKVGAGYKGIVIKNGKKVLVK